MFTKIKAIAAALLLLITPSTVFAETQEEAKAAVDRLLAQLGGAPVWAAAKGAYIYEVHVSQWARLPYTHQVWIDFEIPRVLVRIENHDLRQLRALNMIDGWWVQEGRIEPYSPDFMADEVKRWLASTYRLLHLAAKEDRNLTYNLNGDVLEFQLEDKPVLRITLDDWGKPVSYSRFNNNFGSETLVGAIEEYGNVGMWKFVQTTDGALVSHNLKFRLLPDGPRISFLPPEDLNDIERPSIDE